MVVHRAAQATVPLKIIALDRGEAGYSTAMVMVLPGTLLMMISTSCVPTGTPAGTCTFTW